MANKPEVIIHEEDGSFCVEYSDFFSFTIDSRFDFLDIMCQWKVLFDEVGFDNLFKMIAEDIEEKLFIDIRFKGAN